MVNLKKHAESLGKMDIIIFVLIDLKGEIKEVIVFIIKIKPRVQNVLLKQSLCKTQQLLFTINNREDLDNLDDIPSLKKSSRRITISR